MAKLSLRKQTLEEALADEKDVENRDAHDEDSCDKDNSRINESIEESEVGEVKIDSALMHEIEEEGRHTSSIRPFPGHVSDRIQRAVSLALNLIPENNKRVLKKTFSFSPLVDFLTSHSSSNHRPWVALAAQEEEPIGGQPSRGGRNSVLKSESDVEREHSNTEHRNNSCGNKRGDKFQNDAEDHLSADLKALDGGGPVFRFTPSGSRSLDSVSPDELNEALRALRGYQKPSGKGARKKK